MKKLIPIVTLSAIFLMVCLFTASSQQGKGNGKEKTQKGNTNANVGNANAANGKGQLDKVNQGKGNSDQSQKGQGNKNDKRENANNDNGRADDNKGNGKGNNKRDEMSDNGKDGKMNNGKKDKDYYNSVFGYNWNNENFKERRKLRNQDKVSVCHKFSSNDGVNINVSENAVKAHLNHGDVIGDCPMFNDRRYSNGYYDNRNNYYNNLQNTQEQVYYSQSVLEYALARLTNSRTQLQVMQNNRLPVADIQRKQESVVQLEQNVSLLETLIGVAVAVVGNQL
jgi:hypothetical protein